MVCSRDYWRGAEASAARGQGRNLEAGLQAAFPNRGREYLQRDPLGTPIACVEADTKGYMPRTDDYAKDQQLWPTAHSPTHRPEDGCLKKEKAGANMTPALPI